MSDGGSGDPAAPVAGAGSAQEAAELPTEPGEPEAPASQGTVPAAAPDAAPPLREDQIANAVSFLSHDKVRASGDDAKRSFLERKGLTAAEIAEAFARVPSLPVPPAPAGPAPYSTGAAPATSSAALAAPQHSRTLAQQPQQPAPEPQGIRWTQVALGAGVVAVSAYALNRLLKPYIVSAYDRWTASIAAKAAPKADQDATMVDRFAEAIQAQTAELRATVAGLRDTATAMDADLLRKTLGELKDTVADLKAKSGGTDGGDVISKADLRRELRSFATTLSDFSGVTGEAAELKAEVAQMRQLLAEAVRSGAVGGGGSPSRSAAGSVAMHTPFASPDAGSNHVSPGYANNPDKIVNGLPPVHHTEPVEDDDSPGAPLAGPSEPLKPTSYTEILDMLNQGRTPPGIRTDINDKPPDPSQPPSDARLQPRPKPWERAASASSGGAGSLPARSPSAEAANGAASRPSASEGGGGWRPPPVPQPSLRLGQKQGGSPAPSVDGSLAGSSA